MRCVRNGFQNKGLFCILLSMTENVPTVRQVAEVIDDCQKWFSHLLFSFFYSASTGGNLLEIPSSYTKWAQDPATKSGFQKNLLDDLTESSQALKEALDEAKVSIPPSRVAFEKLTQSYELFLSQLNHAQNELILSGAGTDPLTGFKINALLLPEVRRELDRRGRKGNPFSLAMIRLDGNPAEAELAYKLRAISTALRQGLRSFDDVYKVSNTDLLIALKHADLKGGFRFIERLKLELKNIQADFTFSSCVAEPDPADDLDRFLQNLAADLTQISSYGGGQTMKYEEISPLQRFVSTMKDKN